MGEMLNMTGQQQIQDFLCESVIARLCTGKKKFNMIVKKSTNLTPKIRARALMANSAFGSNVICRGKLARRQAGRFGESPYKT